MKMVLEKLRILTLKVRITVFVIIMALMQMKHGCMGIGFIRQNMVFLVMEERLKRSPPNNLTRWIITQSKGFTRKDIEKIRRSVGAYVHLVLTSQVQARSSVVGNSASTVNDPQVFKSTFKALINEDYSISVDMDKYQGVSEHALSKVDFSIGTGIYMIPRNLNIKHRKDGRI